MTPEHRWLTTAEVAEGLGVSTSTVRRWLRDNRIDGRRIGKRWLIPRAAEPDLTVAEVATLVRAHPDTVRRWLAHGRLPGRRHGRRWTIPRADILEMVEGRSATGYTIEPN